MKKLVFGVGINDADYKVYNTDRCNGKLKILSVCPFYRTWVHMLRRCYSDVFQKRRPTYVGCTVCEEWKTFSQFRLWMADQDFEGKHLDKDIIKQGNKHYCPDFCAFVEPKVNTFFLDCGKRKGLYPTGVSWDKPAQKYRAQCQNPFTKKKEFLGRFETVDSALQAWAKRKVQLASIYASEQSDERVATGILRKVKYQSEALEAEALERSGL